MSAITQKLPEVTYMKIVVRKVILMSEWFRKIYPSIFINKHKKPEKLTSKSFFRDLKLFQNIVQRIWYNLPKAHWLYNQIVTFPLHDALWRHSAYSSCSFIKTTSFSRCKNSKLVVRRILIFFMQQPKNLYFGACIEPECL